MSETTITIAEMEAMRAGGLDHGSLKPGAVVVDIAEIEYRMLARAERAASVRDEAAQRNQRAFHRTYGGSSWSVPKNTPPRSAGVSVAEIELAINNWPACRWQAALVVSCILQGQTAEDSLLTVRECVSNWTVEDKIKCSKLSSQELHDTYVKRVT